jgi:hypothetical protein
MSVLKMIAGVGCMVGALLLGCFSLLSFHYWQNICIACVPFLFTIGLFVAGEFFFAKRSSPSSKQTRILIGLVLGIPVMSIPILYLDIRRDRKVLQMRATEFLSRPVPGMFNTNQLGIFSESADRTVLSMPRAIIARYAKNGRIRWSARIQGEFAMSPFGVDACEEAAKTNEAARLYVVDCKAILDEEWRMGFWQWVEDTLEMKTTIPEIEEEDAKAPASTNAVSQRL